MRNKSFFVKVFMIVTMLALVSTPFGQASAENNSFPTYSDPVELGFPLSGGTAIYDGAAGFEDGHDVLYTTTKGIPAQFSVIDLDTGETLRTLMMEGAHDSWHHEVAPDGTVYVTGGSFIWGYSPETKEIQALAEIPEASLWALAVDEESNAYIGTYPSGKVFKYEKATGELHDYGQMIGDQAQEYVRSMDYHDSYIYAGTAHDKLIRLDLETGEKVDIAEELNESGFVYDLNVVDDRYVFARYSVSKKMYIYDIQEGVWLDVVLENVTGLHVADSLEGNVYFVADGILKYVNLETLEVHGTNMAYGSGLRGADWVEIEGDERLPGKSLATVTFGGEVTFFNIETETVLQYKDMVPPTANVTNKFFTYSEDKIYMSGMTGAVGAVFNPLTEEMTSITLGQADVMHEMDGKMYFGLYPSGSVAVSDPEVDPYAQPTELFVIGEEQERLHSMASGDGKLFIGSIPTYGKLGGALTVYDGETHKVFRHIVEDQSVNDIIYHNGLVYGATSITGGLGSTPTAEEAKLFVFDPETEEKTKEVTLSIDGLDKPAQIGQLKVGLNDDYIWGASKGFVFALDPDTLEVVKSVNIVPNPALGAWNNVHLEWSKDGFLYANAGSKLYVIDPVTLEFQYITDTMTFTLGENGHIYYAPIENRTKLLKIEVTPPATEETLDSLGSFIDSYYQEGELPHPTYKQLTNQLKQAKHFEQKGEPAKVERHLQKMVQHLERWNTDSDVKEILLDEIKSAMRTGTSAT
ncbi:FIMAH domain-containing protein [Paucisalibacillus globulus]|uniref:FIMAH domain-containing protein n=1 Tax=Paucisalibacillus globulus TaxID=351095 RepID=UPI000BB89156|nr:PQQ-binding-like beta-propeller repeat protein [Paucisalibacillus globulus]